jgi:hypothetical protein
MPGRLHRRGEHRDSSGYVMYSEMGKHALAQNQLSKCESLSLDNILDGVSGRSERYDSNQSQTKSDNLDLEN